MNINRKKIANKIFIILVVILVGTVIYFALVKKLPSQNQSISTNNLFSQQISSTTNNSSTTTPFNKKSVIKIPLIDDSPTNLNDKDLIGCGDKIVYISEEVEATTQPLNAAYKKLFTIGPTVNFEGKELINPIADQARERIITYENRFADALKPLRFIKAEIQDSIAKVYLKGDLVSNECNDPRVEAQIIFTAKQFPNIIEVKTYLNDKEFNWKAWMNQKG